MWAELVANTARNCVMEFRYLSRQEAHSIDAGVAVVVDVMRAYATAAWAFHLGARRIILSDDVEQAVLIASTIEGSLLFRDGEPDDRFDLHNSPHQLKSLDVADRTIVQKTTAGTMGATAARGADHLFCAGYPTARATSDQVSALNPELVTFVVTGSNGTAEEDLSCAELIAARIAGVDPDATEFVERARQSTAAARLAAGVAAGYAGVAAEDVELCLQVDRFDFAMRASEVDVGLVLAATV